jgi:hypothetical protein
MTAEEFATMESILDNVAHELILGLDDENEKVIDAYYLYRKVVQEAIQAKFPNHQFGNF